MSNIISKCKIFLRSQSIFKNWLIYPKIYFKLTNLDSAIFETKSGLKIRIRTNSTDLMALTNVWLKNEYEIENYNIEDSDTIIDIGSHIGTFSLLVSQFCNKGKIFCYEPMPDNFQYLLSNLKLNQVKNIFPFNLAVSSDSSKLDMFFNTDQSGHSIFSNNNKKITVDSISLKQIFDDNDIKKCKLLKLDCEGSEYQIIENFPTDYFNRIENIAMEYHLADSKPELGKKLIKKLETIGFEIQTKDHYNDMGFLIAKNIN
tara:strand:- start:2622 stop:3398 length:777 start_codon:yes stop_codon:yes gene_type:complete